MSCEKHARCFATQCRARGCVNASAGVELTPLLVDAAFQVGAKLPPADTVMAMAREGAPWAVRASARGVAPVAGLALLGPEGRPRIPRAADKV